MAIYEYNSSTINEYLEESCGFLLNSPDDVFDCGKIIDSCEEIENYSSISYTETLIPFGKIKISSTKTGSKTKKVSSFIFRLETITKKSIILNRLIINWIGFGTLFELDNGLIRQVVPDVSGGGIVK